MKQIKYFSIPFLFIATLVFAAGDKGEVMIHSPKDMAKVETGKKFMIEYHGDAGTEGDHMHLYVDGERVSLLREFKGTVEVGPLKTGKHKICIEINTKMHMPTGAEHCIYVYAN